MLVLRGSAAGGFDGASGDVAAIAAKVGVVCAAEAKASAIPAFIPATNSSRVIACTAGGVAGKVGGRNIVSVSVAASS